MSRIVFDAPAWWRRPGWQLAAAALLALLALAIWWSVLTPVDHDPIVVRAPGTPVPRTLPAPLAAPAAPALPATPMLSKPVAPGVHVAPLGVPHGGAPPPSEPDESDPEPEN